jgi:hypothetical protein
MKHRSQWRWVYVLLLAISLFVIRNQFNITDSFERTRPEGVGLLPVDALVLKKLGYFSLLVPLIMAALFLLSWKVMTLNTPSAVAITTTVVFIALVFYTTWCLFFIGDHI